MFLHGLKCVSRLLWPLLVMSILSVSLAAAQDEPNRVLTPGVAVSGTLDADTVAQVYTFTVEGALNTEITASSDDGLALALLLTDSSGQTIAQGADAATSGEVTLSGESLLPDTYYVTVFPVGGGEGAFELTLAVTGASGDTAVAGSNIATSLLTTSGLQVTLTWNSIANLDLEVRDPVGGSVYWTTPTVPSGGRLVANVNQECAAVTDDSPSEQASWAPGAIPTGSYEVLVYFQQDCAETGDPVTFTVAPVVDGQALEPVEGTLEPNQIFITSFGVAADGAVAQGANGVNTDTTLAAEAQDSLDSAAPIARGTPAQGVITSEQPFQVYAFSGQANDVVTISMNAISGNLDPLLFLLDGNGNLIDINDDADEGVTNAAISDRPLVTGGTYIVVATRYGQGIGGTEGDYELTLAGPTADVPAEVLALNLPQGAIEVSLVWNTGADLQLLVRDPRGDSVFDDDPDIPSGGRIAASGNVDCNPTAAGAPVSYIYWPEARIPAGLYEVEVWYQNQCNDNQPVRFTLTILVNDEVIFTDLAQPLPNERYVTSFMIGVDGAVTPGDGGIVGGSDTLDYQSELEAARSVASGETLTGNITSDNKFDVYVFEGQAEDVVTIGAQATSGTLDTTLYLIGPDGTEIARNDDAVPNETTDSLISDFTLPEDGRYIIIATHFGGLFGGTSGVYSLTFQQVD